MIVNIDSMNLNMYGVKYLYKYIYIYNKSQIIIMFSNLIKIVYSNIKTTSTKGTVPFLLISGK